MLRPLVRVKARKLYAAPQWSCASQAETTKPLATDSKVLFLLRSPPLFFTELNHGSCSISCREAPSRLGLVPASAVTFPLFATVKLSCLTQVGLTVICLKGSSSEHSQLTAVLHGK